MLLPLLACITSPAWYLLLFDPRPLSVASVLGLLAAGWVPWLLALLGTVALADKYELVRHPRGGSEADAWDRFAVRLLTITGGLGVVLTLVLAGMVLSVATP